MNFSIIIPVYNEEENIKKLYKQIVSSIKENINYEIFFINDGSNDNTLDEIKKIKDEKLKFISNNNNMGQSLSILTGIENSTFETIVTIDGDLQNDPEDIIKLVKIFYAEKLCLIGGIRNKRKDSIFKIVASKLANRIRMILLNDDCVDTGCSLKVFKKSIFLKIPKFNGMHRFLPAIFKSFNCKIKFINVNHRPRMHGKSKYGNLLRLFQGIRDIFKVLQIIKKIKSQ